MFRAYHRPLFLFLLLLLLAGGAAASRYMYLSDTEETVLGECVRFWHGDTLEGCVRTNGRLCIMQDPQFYDCVITSAPDVDHGSGYNPGFHYDHNITFNAPVLEFPTRANELRDGAAMQGTFYADSNKSYRVYLRDGIITVCRWWTGTLFDSTDRWDIPMVMGRCLFFDGPLELLGRLDGQLTIGSSRTVLLLDNIYYHCSALRPSGGYVWSPEYDNNCTDLLQVVSEADIKVANTWANGRENSHLRGYNQTNRDSTDIVIMGALVALGESFTFEQQNDVDSGYVYQYPDGTPHTDDRGQIWLHGSLVQKRRGYVHRSSAGSTGYLKKYKYDLRFRHMTPPCDFLFYQEEQGITTDTLDFGGVPIGQTVWDTAHVYVDGDVTLGSVTASSPFTAYRIPPYFGGAFDIPVRLTVSHAGQYSGILQVITPYEVFQIPLRAEGLPGLAPPPHFDISPNPFNAITTLRYTLEQPGSVKIVLYDVLGRAAKVVDVEHLDAGEHSLQISGADLASGVYFAELQTGEQRLTRKLLLLK